MIRALLIDLYATALHPVQTVAVTYAERGRALGVEQDPTNLMARFHVALEHTQTEQRMLGDGRVFWETVVARATGCDDPAYFEGLFRYFGSPEAYRLAPALLDCCHTLRAAGVKVAIVSNADTRTHRVTEGLGLAQVVDLTLLSSELPWDKPDPRIFHHACALLGTAPGRAVHVGDSLRYDVRGARAAGCRAWHWGVDVTSFAEVAVRVQGS